jgi:hypothetical protein
MSRMVIERSAPLAILLALLLAGCTQWRYEFGEPLTPEALKQAGDHASLSEVLAALGPPARISAAGKGLVMAWEFWQIREDTLGISLGTVGTDLLSVDWGKAHMHGEFLLVTFDHEYRMTGSAFSRWSNEAGDGRALQPMIGMSLVSVEDMIGPMPHHRWGATLLQPLPSALNTPSRPDQGQSGIQRRGTPSGSGQQSLE